MNLRGLATLSAVFNRLNLVARYLRNDRCREYELILKNALQGGYSVCSVYQSLELLKKGERRILTLRHDVDQTSPATRKFFSIEKKLNVTASYYFRLNTLDRGLVRDIENYGSEASLHYETISDYAKARGIKNKADLDKIDFKSECLRLLKSDLDRFRVLTEAPCQTIASHGGKINRAFQVSNNWLTEDDSVYDYLGIELEVYNRSFLSLYGIYISDTAIEINGGYRYGCEPMSAIAESLAPIMFLTHPNHWYFTGTKRLAKCGKTLLLGPVRIKEEFKRI